MAIVSVAFSGQAMFIGGAEKLDYRLKSSKLGGMLRGHLLIGGLVGKRRRVVSVELDENLMEHWIYPEGRPSATPLSVGFEYDHLKKVLMVYMGAVQQKRGAHTAHAEVPLAAISMFLNPDPED